MSNVKAVFGRKFLSRPAVEIGSKITIFWEKGGVDIKFRYCNPKKQSLRETASFDVFRAKIHTGVLAVGDLKTPKNSRVNFGPDWARNRACAETKPLVRSG